MKKLQPAFIILGNLIMLFSATSWFTGSSFPLVFVFLMGILVILLYNETLKVEKSIENVWASKYEDWVRKADIVRKETLEETLNEMGNLKQVAKNLDKKSQTLEKALEDITSSYEEKISEFRLRSKGRNKLFNEIFPEK